MPVFLFLKALPTWVKVGAACGLIIAGLEVKHWWETRDLKRDLVKQEQLLKETQEAAAAQAIQLQQEAQNRQLLEEANARQNERINSIAARARQAEAAASLATMRALKEGQDAADALRDKDTTVPVGEQAMNAWLKQRFSEVPK